jgi:hypothetical protein
MNSACVILVAGFDCAANGKADGDISQLVEILPHNSLQLLVLGVDATIFAVLCSA